MAPVVSTAFEVSEGDGDLGDPRGAIELMAAPRGGRASSNGSCAMACASCGALLRLMLIACGPGPLAVRSEPQVTVLDSLQQEPPATGA